MLRRLLIPLFLITTSYAAEPIDGLYSVGFGGLALVPGNFNNYINNYQVNSSKYNSGFDAGGALGYKQAFWRYEAEVTYIKADLNRVKINQIIYNNPTTNGYSQGLVGLLNAYIDLPYKHATLLQPFIGAGLGYAWIQNNLNLQPIINSTINNNSFAYQGTVGLTFHFSENYALNFAYRYVGTTHMDSLGSTFGAHLINGGVIYRFDECEFK